MLGKSDARMPKEVWWIVYACVFERHIDWWFTALSCFLMFLFVFLGVSHDVSRFSGVYWGADVTTWFSAENIGIPITISLAVSVGPVFFVTLGNWVVRSACEYAKDSIENMKKTKQAQVLGLSIPIVPSS